MTARSRHAKPKSLASRFGPLAAAVAMLVGVAAVFLLIQGGPADAGSSQLTFGAGIRRPAARRWPTT